MFQSSPSGGSLGVFVDDELELEICIDRFDTVLEFVEMGGLDAGGSDDDLVLTSIFLNFTFGGSKDRGLLLIFLNLKFIHPTLSIIR